MNAVIIPDFSNNSLTPLLCTRRIYELPVMGLSIEQHIRKHLSGHGIVNTGVCRDFSADTLARFCDKDGVIAIEGNLITGTNIHEVVSAHLKSRADITVVLRKVENLADKENNSSVSCVIGNINSGKYQDTETEGIYIFSKSALEILSTASSVLCGDDIFKAAKLKNLKISGYLSTSHSISISGPDDYIRCHSDILTGSLPNYTHAAQVRDGFFIENDVCLESGVKIETPVYISNGCRIEKNARIGSGTFIGRDCTIKSGSYISHSVIGSSCSLSENASVSGGILDENISLGRNTKIMDSAIIGSGCRVEGDCIVSTGVKVWPNKRILKGTRLNDNLIWGSVGTEHLFRNGKICGEINVDITPEFMAKLGSALGTMYRECKIGLSFDSAPVCALLSSAAESGLASTGTRVFNFGEQSLPAARLGTRFYSTAMTLHISQASEDGSFCPELEFIESDGSCFSPLNQRKLEGIFFNNIYLRTDTKKLRETTDLSQYRLFYIQEILNQLKSNRFERNMELRTRSETLSDILEILLGEIENMAREASPREFSADLSFNGQELTLFDGNGQQLNKSGLLYIISVVLIRHFGCRTIVLPVYASSALEEMLISEKMNIIKCGVSATEFINTLLKNNLCTQFRMCFDGIYCAVMLLDYLNHSHIGFDALLQTLPSDIRLETEVECPNSRKSDIINKLRAKYSNNKIDMTDGIKIYQNNGWVLVIPEKHRHYVKIITEGANMEAAEEISAEFTNRIKKLAKLQ